MFDIDELFQVAADHRIAVQEGVATGNERVADFRVLPDVIGHLRHVISGLVVGDPHQAFAETVTAVHGAAVGGQDQHRLIVLVLQTR